MANTACPDTIAFVEGLNQKFEETRYTFEALPGQVRDKVMTRTPYGHGSIHAFVDRATGAILKAEGLKKPAKGARYPNYREALAVADLHGAYLYQRR